MTSSDNLQLELLKLLEAKEAAIKYNKLDTLFPDKGAYRRELYPVHLKFMNSSSNHSQLAFIAANRVGKTLTAAVLVAYHATGKYPAWYTGRRFLNPTSIWVAGKTTQQTREVIQDALLGDITDIGTGTIPKECIVGTPTMKGGVPGTVEVLRVKHVSGGFSTITFKSYEQGREVFQGTYKHIIWLDEEPRDMSVYTECLTRTMHKVNPGIVLCTFTPLFGMSELVLSFMPGGRIPESGSSADQPDKFAVQVGWNEVPHMDESQKKALLDSYKPWERAARSRGIPSAGAGAIYPFAEEDVTCKPFEIPAWWPRCYGLDVGWNRTAAIWIAQDPDSKCLYAYSEYYVGELHPAIHASNLKTRGEWVPGAIDPASSGKSQIDGKQLIDLYTQEGLILEYADNALEAGLLNVRRRLESGQLKIFSTLKNTLMEMFLYSRDETGKVIVNSKDKKDHLMDALRYAIHTGLDLMCTEPDFATYEESEYVTKGRSKITGY